MESNRRVPTKWGWYPVGNGIQVPGPRWILQMPRKLICYYALKKGLDHPSPVPRGKSSRGTLAPVNSFKTIIFLLSLLKSRNFDKIQNPWFFHVYFFLFNLEKTPQFCRTFEFFWIWNPGRRFETKILKCSTQNDASRFMASNMDPKFEIQFGFGPTPGRARA